MCNGWEHREYKRDKARRCSRLVRPLKEIGKETCSSCIQLQRLAHPAHRVLLQPVQVGLLVQEPWR
jgi:hypothetical protein